MKRYTLVLAWLALASSLVGCGSESGKKPKSMGEIGAQLEQQAAASSTTSGTASAEGSAATAAASGASATSPAAPASNPGKVDPSLASKRGYDLTDWSNEAAYVLVKADVVKTSELLAELFQGKIVKDVLGKPSNDEIDQLVVFQFAGHPWSIFACSSEQLENLMPMSRDTDVIMFWNSDFSGWAEVALFRGGQEVEMLRWGPAEDKLGEDADASKWQAEGQKTITHDDFSYAEAFLFRSKERKATPAELSKGEEFVSAMFKHYDAYLPDVEQMPWFDYDTKLISSPLAASNFAGVHAVVMDGP